MQAFRIVGDSRSRGARPSSITSLILIGHTFSLWCALIHDEAMADDAIAAAGPRRAPGLHATWPTTSVGRLQPSPPVVDSIADVGGH
jgi:hypothetical protein